MNTAKLTRRGFAKALVAGAAFAPSMVEAAVQEAATNAGKISDDTALTLLKHIGYEPTLPDEMKTLKPMLEQTIRDLQIIRDFQVPIALEPAFVFHADR